MESTSTLRNTNITHNNIGTFRRWPFPRGRNPKTLWIAVFVLAAIGRQNVQLLRLSASVANDGTSATVEYTTSDYPRTLSSLLQKDGEVTEKATDNVVFTAAAAAAVTPTNIYTNINTESQPSTTLLQNELNIVTQKKKKKREIQYHKHRKGKNEYHHSTTSREKDFFNHNADASHPNYTETTQQQQHHQHQKHHPKSPYGLPIPWKDMPHFILGFSTGHAGSTSLHRALVARHCPWNSNSSSGRQFFAHRFENQAENETLWDYGTSTSSINASCTFVSQQLLPKLLQDIQEWTRSAPVFRRRSNRTDPNLPLEYPTLSRYTYLDLGHYHNRGRVVECLARLLKEKLTLIRIRRHRHDIASSFIQTFDTPCIRKVHPTTNTTSSDSHDDNNHNSTMATDGTNTTSNSTTNATGTLVSAPRQRQRHPRVTTCPRSTDRAGPIALPIDDDRWDNRLTSFQKFLWYADEIELRWYNLQKTFSERIRRPNFVEVTWTTKEDFAQAAQRLRRQLGCTPLAEIPHTKRHIHHFSGTINNTNNMMTDDTYFNATNNNGSTVSISETTNWTLSNGTNVTMTNSTTTTTRRKKIIHNCTYLQQQDFEYRRLLLPLITKEQFRALFASYQPRKNHSAPVPRPSSCIDDTVATTTIR